MGPTGPREGHVGAEPRAVRRHARAGDDVVAALGRVGAQVLRTDRVGTIVVHTDGRHITYEAAGRNWRIPTQQ